MRRAASPTPPSSSSALRIDDGADRLLPASKRVRSSLSPLGADATLRLPLDILRIITEYIPDRPRLLVLRRVCRRWRTAVDSSVIDVALTIHWYFLKPDLSFTYLKALRSFSLDSSSRNPRSVLLPLSITSLTLRTLGSVCESLPALTALRELDLCDVHENKDEDPYEAALITANAPSLVRLAPSRYESLWLHLFIRFMCALTCEIQS